MKITVDQDALGRHLRHLDAAFKASPLPWEIGTFAAVEALHVVAARRDRAWAAKLFRDLADTLEEDQVDHGPKIDPKRLRRIEDTAGIISPKQWNKADLGKNPPTDPFIISVCNMMGRGWPEGEKFTLGTTDLTADMRLLFDQLDALNAPLGEFEEERDIDRDAVRVVGHKLNDIAGIDAMRAAAEALRPMVGSVVQRLDWAWDGIGQWRW